MATRTVACPECGSEAGFGRYTCAECGALLDGVAVRPRSSELEIGDEPAPTSATPFAGALESAAPDWPRAAAAAPSWPAAADELMSAPTDDSGEDAWIDDDAPLGATTGAAAAVPPGDRPEPQWPIRPADDPVARPPHREQRPPDPSEPRVAAGPSLPPSAVLPPIGVAIAPNPADRPLTSGAVAAAPSAVPVPTAAAFRSLGDRAATAVREWLDVFGKADRRAAQARRTIATGAGVALLGFLLPWASAPLDLLAANWIDLWGLAGGGHWLIVLGLIALGLVAARDRTATWPVALPALTVGALLLGLVWPYVLGSTSRPFGTLVVLAGAIVLVGGGSVGLAGRHEDATPNV